MEANVGAITARLAIDMSAWTQALRQAQQQLQAFYQQVTQAVGTRAAALAQTRARLAALLAQDAS
jgi:hypothetical protein